MRWRYRIIGCLGLLSAHVFADDAAVRKDVWSVGYTGMRMNYQTANGNSLLGNATVVQLGKGYIDRSWFANLSADIVLGPYTYTHDNQLAVDYTGTGVSAWWGHSAQLGDIRTLDPGYGFALGLSYSDIGGRSVGLNRKASQGTSPSDDLINDYTMRVTSFTMVPAIFFSWLQPGRPLGNAPELLTTRIEGYVLTIGFGIPLQATYNARFLSSTANREVSQTGSFEGYTVNVSLAALLGI